MPAENGVDFGSYNGEISRQQTMVDAVFRNVAGRYDLMNDLMSVGVHRLWKDELVSAVNPPRGDQPFAIIDVAGGTGDIAFRMAVAGGPGISVTVCDINPQMIAVGRERAEAGKRVRFACGNAEALPFRNRQFDACTIAFGIRNVPRIETALSECYRVLRPGSRFLCLEFSAVDVPGFDALYDFYSFNVIPLLGQTVAGNAAPYRYLVESIRRFPPAAAFSAMMATAGFRRVNHRLFTGGMVALYSGWRL
jgi:demethylmenaquinone methyltransferase / 2-methoxy-6-polyprenyl-1,4-benzoquinol methylase